MSKRNLFIILAISIFVATPALCQNGKDARRLFIEGNALYADEKFKEAIADYEKAIRTGFENGPLYYNLGNAYFKDGQLGMAVLNYLRAERLMPGDADLKSNLKYANSLVKTNVLSPDGKWYIRLFLGIADSFTLDGLTITTALLYLALAIGVLFAATMKGSRKILAYVNWSILALFIISLSLFGARYYKQFYLKEAVVVAQNTDCKFEPFIGATTFFTLTEGERVSVRASKKDWLKVRRPDGKQGWVKRSDIEFL